MPEPTEAARAIRLKAIRQRDEDAAGSTSAAALDRRWLLGEIDRLRPPVPDGHRTPSDWCARYGLVVHSAGGWRTAGSPRWTDPIGLSEFAQRISLSSVEGAGLKRLMDDAARVVPAENDKDNET